jgi:hypothetical protein
MEPVPGGTDWAIQSWGNSKLTVLAESVYVFQDKAVAAGLGPELAVSLEPGDDEGELDAVSVAVVVLSGVPVPDSELLGCEEVVEVTCGPLFSAEQAAPPTIRTTPRTSTESLVGAAMPCLFRMPFMRTA